MNLVKLLDRSIEYVEFLIEQLNPELTDVDRIKTILTNANNLHLLKYEGHLCGFINPKPDYSKGVVFCPIYLMDNTNYFVVDDILDRIKSIFSDDELIYCVFMNIFHLSNVLAQFIQNEPFDKSVSMSLELNEFINIGKSSFEELEFKIEDLDYAQLLNLHLKAYAYEPPYVIGEWDQLIQNFLSLGDNVVVSCKFENKLIGACLGIAYLPDNYHYIYSVCVLPQYQGKGYGFQLMNNFLALTKSLSYRLDVQYSNTNARKLYESLGFREASTNNFVYKL